MNFLLICIFPLATSKWYDFKAIATLICSILLKFFNFNYTQEFYFKKFRIYNVELGDKINYLQLRH